MIVVLRVGIEALDNGAQTVISAQLRVDQRDQMIPAPERLVVRIPLHAIHSRLKLPPVDRFKKSSKNAIAKPHARFLSESRQPESTCFMRAKPGMHRDIVNHSPDTPARISGPRGANTKPCRLPRGQGRMLPYGV